MEDPVANSLNAPRAWVTGDRVASLSVSRDVYSRRAVLATAYKLSDKFVVLVDDDGPERWLVSAIAPTGGDAAAALPHLVQELADQALRDQLEGQFGAVRTLIVAQAFAEGNLLGATAHHEHSTERDQ
jgi:His-Xaa-Ser system protein HxsD